MSMRSLSRGDLGASLLARFRSQRSKACLFCHPYRLSFILYSINKQLIVFDKFPLPFSEDLTKAIVRRSREHLCFSACIAAARPIMKYDINEAFSYPRPWRQGALWEAFKPPRWLTIHVGARPRDSAATILLFHPVPILACTLPFVRLSLARGSSPSFSLSLRQPLLSCPDVDPHRRTRTPSFT